MRIAGLARMGLGVLAAAALLAGCRATPDHSALDAEAARALVREQARSVRDLSAAVSLSIETEEFEGSLSGALLVAPPDRMRLRTEKLLHDVFDLIVTPDELELLWFRDRTFYRRRFASGEHGTLSSQSSFVLGKRADDEARGPIEFLEKLDARALRLALCGFELPETDVVAGEAAREGRKLWVRETLADGDRLERRFDGRTLFLEKVTLRSADGGVRLRASYDDHEPVEPVGGDADGSGSGALWLPGEMELEDLVTGVRFEMSFDDVAVNEGVLPGAFELEPPPGVPVQDLQDVQEP